MQCLTTILKCRPKSLTNIITRSMYQNLAEEAYLPTYIAQCTRVKTTPEFADVDWVSYEK